MLFNLFTTDRQKVPGAPAWELRPSSKPCVSLRYVFILMGRVWITVVLACGRALVATHYHYPMLIRISELSSEEEKWQRECPSLKGCCGSVTNT